MTTMTASPATAEDQLRTVLRVDGVVTAALGAFALFGPTWYGGPDWVTRGVGVGLLAVGLGVLGWARSRGDSLRTAGVVVADAAFAWVVTLLAVLALVDMDTAGREVVVVTALATLAFGITETRLARRMR